MSPQSEWISKADAAQALGVSPRQIERHIAAGRLRSRREPRRPHETAAPVSIAAADVEAIRAGRPNYHPVVEKSGTMPDVHAANDLALLVPPPAAPAAPAPDATALLDRLARLLPPPPPPRPWLSTEEAAAFSGLPAAWLRRAAAEGRIAALNVGVKRPRWRILRSALERPIEPASPLP